MKIYNQSHMRNLIVIPIVTLLFISSCTTEAPEFDFTVSLKNESENTFTVVALNDKDEIIFEQILNYMDSSEECMYRRENFQGFNCSSIDSISVIFENGKGYACDMRLNNISTEYCFSGKNPFSGSNGFRDLGSNTYEFVVTKQDFNNAHDLPE